ncbi:MAG: ribosomal protein [Verrucomicrobiota bacterium]
MADQKDISAAPAAPAGSPSGGTQSFGGDRPSRGYSDGGRGRGPRRGSRDQRDNDEPKDGLIEKVVHINRSSKVVKGGRRFSFSALIVVGDKQGKVGMGMGKGAEVSEAIKKGGENAKSRISVVSLSASTIPHEVYSEFGGAKVLLRPASPGTGLICGKTVRAVVESAGVKDVLSKSLGSKNASNVAKATLNALLSLRTREQILKARGLENRINATKTA